MVASLSMLTKYLENILLHIMYTHTKGNLGFTEKLER